MINFHVPDTLDAINKLHREIRHACRKAFDHRKQRRQTLMQEQIEAMIKQQPNQDPAKISATVKLQQQDKDMWRSMPTIKSNKSNGISCISVPVDRIADPKDPETPFMTLVDPVEVEQRILERNKLHFSQAKDAPMAQPQVIEALGFGANTETSERILAGEEDTSKITDDYFAQCILEHSQTRAPMLCYLMSV